MLRKGVSPTVKPQPEEWEKRQGRKRRSKARRKYSQKGIVTAFIIFLTTLTIGFCWYFTRAQSLTANLPTSSPAGSQAASDPNSHQKLTVPESTLYNLPPLTVAKNFALTSDIEERLKWVRNPEVIRKHLSQYSLDARETVAHRLTPQGDITTGDLHYTTFLAELPDGDQRFLCVIGTPDGPRVDWDAYARYGTASWDDILAGKVTQATVRIFPQFSTHYLRNFRDRKKWLALALASPDLETPIYGYLDKTSALFTEVQPMLNSGALRATIDLKISPEDIQHRQVEITGFHTLGWVKP